MSGEVDIRSLSVTGRFADELGVERFTKAMLAKLARKRDEGRGGWNHQPYTSQPDRGDVTEYFGCSVADLQHMLAEHIAKGDMVDIANFAMMIWNRENPDG